VTKENSFEALKEYFSKVPKDYQYVVEFRSADWQDEEVYEFLKKSNITLAMSEVQNQGVTTQKDDKRTSDLSYVRIIGKHGVLSTFDRMELSDEAIRILKAWAQTVKESKHAMVFINNNFAGNAPETANYFKSLLGMEQKEWKSDLTRYFG
jgi:uncharacterized protein YecE (DUF72 family)